MVVSCIKDCTLLKCTCCKRIISGLTNTEKSVEDDVIVDEKLGSDEKDTVIEAEKKGKRPRKCCLRNEFTTKVIDYAKSKFTTLKGEEISTEKPPKNDSFDNKNYNLDNVD